LPVAFLIGSVVLVLENHEVAGSILGGIDLVGLATAFIYGSRSRRLEREQSLAVLTGRAVPPRQ
jgi:hypothetical protein